MLRTVNLAAFYDRTQVLHDINLRVEEGEIIGLVGANGAGKSSTLFSLMGLKTRTEGELWLDGERIEHLPTYERVRRALVLIPERRHLFPLMSVLENLSSAPICLHRANSAKPRWRRCSICFRCLPSAVIRLPAH